MGFAISLLYSAVTRRVAGEQSRKIAQQFWGFGVGGRCEYNEHGKSQQKNKVNCPS